MAFGNNYSLQYNIRDFRHRKLLYYNVFSIILRMKLKSVTRQRKALILKKYKFRILILPS